MCVLLCLLGTSLVLVFWFEKLKILLSISCRFLLVAEPWRQEPGTVTGGEP